MARGERAESGQRAPGPAAAAAAGAARGEDSRRPSAPPHSPRAPRAAPAAPARLRGGRDQRPAPPPPAPTAGLRGPHPSRLLEPHRRRRKRAHLERSRRAAGTEARGAASPVAAAARGVAEKAPFSGAVRACCPAPRSRCPPAGPRPRALPAPRLDARSLGFPLRHRRGRRQAAGLCGGGEPGARTPARRRRGPESPAWGRSEAAAGGAGAAEWTAPPLPAWGLLSTAGPWSGDREVGAAGGGRRWRGLGRPGRGPGERGRAPPDNAPGGQAPAEGLRPAPRPLCLPPPSRTEPQRPSLPPGPLSCRLV